MLFGFVGAAVAGFLLTAIPNWTGRLPVAGGPLAALFAIWVAGRLAVFFSATTGLLIAGMVDIGFFLALAFVAAREVIAAKNRNLPVVGLILLFGLADAGDYAAAAGLLRDPLAFSRAAISLVVVMISIIGGRIVPSFTRNWLMKQGQSDKLPIQPNRFDRAAIAATAIALLFWVTFPVGAITAALLLISATLQASRLFRWRGYRAVREALLVIMHIGYCWIPIGLLLLCLSGVSTAVPESVAIHALTVGAMGTMILAVMTRATLGHIGRELEANQLTIVIYSLVTLGATLRVAAIFLPLNYVRVIDVAGILWGGAMLLFLIGYGPMLWSPRVGEA